MSTNRFRPTFTFSETVVGMAAVGVLTALGCAAVASHDSTPKGVTITIPEDYDMRFDARPGDTLNLIMYPEGNYVGRCINYGGTLKVDTLRQTYVCQDSNF